ncbi:MAG TPA: response regulator [Verrucomicrobiae bacterium]|jgi:DNA-binding response OmpR family regulator|nr:response regulator [Verrucomicrobiae bacterium]
MRPCKILIVDDDRNLAYLLRQRLEDEGYEVATAHSAAEGFAAYLRLRPHILLTDITMGEEDGLDLVRRVRMHNPKVRTIFMTGNPDRYRSELEIESRLYHAQVLEKPFGGRELARAIACRAQRNRQIAALKPAR